MQKWRQQHRERDEMPMRTEEEQKQKMNALHVYI